MKKYIVLFDTDKEKAEMASFLRLIESESLKVLLVQDVTKLKISSSVWNNIFNFSGRVDLRK